MPIKAANNELIPPSDFDENLRMGVLTKVQCQAAQQPEIHSEFVQAWGGLQYRFYACTEHDEAFTESVRSHGDSPNQTFRFQQERELFNFFINGLSTIECLCYGFFAIGAMVDQKQFPFTSDVERRKVNPKQTRDSYKAAFPNENVSVRLATMLSSADYEGWNDMRRFLFHRSHPGREFNRGGTARPPATWIQGKAVDQDTTAVPRKWLASTLKELLSGADLFVSRYL